ncbi:hypothetical protein UFOVP55_7 [uncultured Caudovirales phage]|uniref:Uncharacterized protein n=1 Tax=uncultured Caudovirales phage TaxID=2100421 RepID=A0A6J5KWA9_9CAUD|nr:hypothetical protein UFOVP55_7 [uncultured Caudovirales phage]
MDPITILLGAKTAFEAIKTGVGYGKELSGMIVDVSNLFGAVNELTKLAAEPPRGFLNTASAEQLALDAFMAKKDAEQMQEEVKNMVISQYGMAGWDEIHREIIRIRKEQKAARIEDARKQQELIEQVLLWGALGFGFFLLVATVVLLAVALVR